MAEVASGLRRKLVLIFGEVDIVSMRCKPCKHKSRETNTHWRGLSKKEPLLQFYCFHLKDIGQFTGLYLAYFSRWNLVCPQKFFSWHHREHSTTNSDIRPRIATAASRCADIAGTPWLVNSSKSIRRSSRVREISVLSLSRWSAQRCRWLTMESRWTELQLQYTNFKNTLQQMAQKVGDMEQEGEEHRWVMSDVYCGGMVVTKWLRLLVSRIELSETNVYVFFFLDL